MEDQTEKCGIYRIIAICSIMDGMASVNKLVENLCIRPLSYSMELCSASHVCKYCKYYKLDKGVCHSKHLSKRLVISSAPCASSCVSSGMSGVIDPAQTCSVVDKLKKKEAF